MSWYAFSHRLGGFALSLMVANLALVLHIHEWSSHCALKLVSPCQLPRLELTGIHHSGQYQVAFFALLSWILRLERVCKAAACIIVLVLSSLRFLDVVPSLSLI